MSDMSNPSKEDAIEAFAQSILRDYLREKGYKKTLECLTTESSEKGISPPSVESWYDISHRIDLPELIRANNAPHGRKHLTLMEVILDRMCRITMAAKAKNRDVTVTVHDRKKISALSSSMSLTMEPETKGASDSILDISTRSSALDITENDSRPTFNNRSNSATKSAQKETRLIKRKPPRSKDLDTPSVSHATSRALGTSKVKSLSKYRLSSSTSMLPSPAAKTLESDAEIDMSRSRENWIPMEVRMRMMRDEFSQKKSRDIEKDKEEKRLKKWQSGTSTLELEKVKEKYSQKRRQICHLCGLEFLLVNLPMTVSYKAIMDLRASWGHIDETNQILARPPRCYDMVRVCMFCSQFFDGPGGQEAYRPIKNKSVGGGYESAAVDLFDPVLDIDTNQQKR